MGGHMQPQGHLQVVSHIVDRGLDPQAALDEPRWRLDTRRATAAGSSPSRSRSTASRRRSRGAATASLCDPTPRGFGGGQVVLVRDDVLIGGSESRKDGVALGY